MVNELARFSANAIIPDQLLPYVGLISGLESVACGSCLLHHSSGYGVLAGYPAHDPADVEAMNTSVALAMEFPRLRQLTVLSSQRPAMAPPDAETRQDYYWLMDLPFNVPSGKLRNMLKRARREVGISSEHGQYGWSIEHETLVEEFCQRKGGMLDEGTVYLFRNLKNYVLNAPEALLFSARRLSGDLAGFAIGDYTAFGTSFYMFAFRQKDSPPGTADVLLEALANEGVKRGHTMLNLGLGINRGVGFFKKKWGARRELPYVETTWRIQARPRSWLARIFGLQ